MRNFRMLLAAALAALAGCSAQEGASDAVQAGLPPQAIDDIVVVETNSANNSILALANDVDQSGTGLAITAVSVDQVVPAAAGAAASTNGSTISFTPPPNFVGVVTLQYAVSDGTGAISSALVAVSVLPVALPPVALPDTVTVTQDSGATDVDVLANDVDFAGGGLTVASVAVATSLPPAAHTVAIVGNQVRFTPAAGFVGVVVLDYTATDAAGQGADGVVTVVVSPLALELGPVAVPDATVVGQDSGATLIDVLANDVDTPGGGLTLGGLVVTASLPTSGAHAVSVSAGQVQFAPAAGFVGTVVVTYTATDVNGNSADGVLSVVVSPLDLAVGPVPVPDAAIVTQDSGATDIDVLANDVDFVGGGLTLTGLAVTASAPAAVHAAVVVANQVRFTPAASFAGVVVITYTATDADGNSADGVLNVVVSPLDLTVGPVPVPDAAVVAQDAAATDIDVLANDVDFVGGGLTLSGLTVTASQPAAVHTTVVAGNQVRFTPAAGFAGVVVITYTATDADGTSAAGVLNVVVSPLALPVGLVAVPDAAVVAQDSANNAIDVLANDVDFAGGGLTLSAVAVFSSVPAATHTVAIVGNQVRFTPQAAFAGVVVVSYTATDTLGQASNGVLNIEVTPAALELNPVALPDAGTPSSSGGVQLFNVLANDLDPAAGGLTLSNLVVNAVPPGAGTFAVFGNQVQYTPAALYAGVVTVTYTATDVNGNTATGTLTLVVTP